MVLWVEDTATFVFPFVLPTVSWLSIQTLVSGGQPDTTVGTGMQGRVVPAAEHWTADFFLLN